jgi:hypothetical protein
MSEDLEPRQGQEIETAHDVVKLACDVLEGTPIPSAHRGIIGRHAKLLLADGFDGELLVVAAVTALRRGAPQHMQFIAADLAMARGGKRMTRREYERALQDEVELRGGKP